jgi:hypothetical protein
MLLALAIFCGPPGIFWCVLSLTINGQRIVAMVPNRWSKAKRRIG